MQSDHTSAPISEDADDGCARPKTGEAVRVTEVEESSPSGHPQSMPDFERPLITSSPARRAGGKAVNPQKSPTQLPEEPNKKGPGHEDRGPLTGAAAADALDYCAAASAIIFSEMIPMRSTPAPRAMSIA